MILNFINALFHNIKLSKFFLYFLPSTTLLQREYMTTLTALLVFPVVGVSSYPPILGGTYTLLVFSVLYIDKSKFESLQKDKSRAQSADSSKIYWKARAFTGSWPTSEFSLLELEHDIALKRNSVISRYLDTKSREISLAPHSFLSLLSSGS